MTDLFIANLTRQTHHFVFRLAKSDGSPRSDKAHQYPIQPGSQVRIPFKLTDDQAMDIISQHEVYGMTSAEVAPKVTYMAYLCYSLGKPVSGPQIDLGFRHNDEILTTDAAENRANAVAATASKIEEETQGTLRHMETQITEIPPAGADPNNVIDHTIEIVTPGETGRRQRRT